MTPEHKTLFWSLIFGALLVVGIVACEGEEPLEQVEWTKSERCLILFGKSC